MTCSHLASTCDGRDVRLVKLYLRPKPRPLCAGCRAALEAHGASFTVVGQDERPAWLRNLTARDETGALVA